jgi:hypothetical protein
MFLTADELLTLTGYGIAAYQRRWLKRNGWKHEVARNGRPVVSRAYAEARLSDAPTLTPVVLNLDAIRKAA